MNHSGKLTILATTAIAAFYVFATQSANSTNHLEGQSFELENLKIDPIITGANDGSQNVSRLPVNFDKYNECPLCFHRELIKKQEEESNLDAEMQPFPSVK